MPHFFLSEIDFDQGTVNLADGTVQKKIRIKDRFPEGTMAELSLDLAQLLKNEVSAEEADGIMIRLHDGSYTPSEIIVSDADLAKRIGQRIGVDPVPLSSQGSSVVQKLDVNFVTATRGANTTLGKMLDATAEKMRLEDRLRPMEITAGASGFQVKFGERPKGYTDGASGFQVRFGERPSEYRYTDLAEAIQKAKNRPSELG